MIFFLPGLLCLNAAIIKHTSSQMSLSAMVGGWVGVCVWGGGGAQHERTQPDHPAVHPRRGLLNMVAATAGAVDSGCCSLLAARGGG
jgi:hypothetical protein